MNKVAVYPGTFDPITYGHLDILEMGCKIFDEIIICIAERAEKNTLFTLEERVSTVSYIVKDFDNVSVEPLTGLLVKRMEMGGIKFILRGLRAVSDFDYELQMALTNSELDSEIVTVFLPGKHEHLFLSSSIVREVAIHGGDVSKFVPEYVKHKIELKLRGKTCL